MASPAEWSHGKRDVKRRNETTGSIDETVTAVYHCVFVREAVDSLVPRYQTPDPQPEFNRMQIVGHLTTTELPLAIATFLSGCVVGGIIVASMVGVIRSVRR